MKAVGAAVPVGSGVLVGPVTVSVAPSWVPVVSTTRTANCPVGEPAGTTAVTVVEFTQVVVRAPSVSTTTTASSSVKVAPSLPVTTMLVEAALDTVLGLTSMSPIASAVPGHANSPATNTASTNTCS